MEYRIVHTIPSSIPRKWKIYIELFAKKIELRQVEVGNLHHVPVDDDAFFPDIS